MAKSFIDLFSGIGGFRIALENNGLDCLFSSEIDKNARLSYYNNYGEEPLGDITQISSADIPEFNVLTGGFPCQPFSISGHKKGFEDTRGTLFFDIARIITDKNPELILLENVKHFLHHDKGNTLKVVKQTIEDLGYHFSYDILNAKDFGIPQSRERIFMVASKKKFFDFSQIEKNISKPLKHFLDKEGDFEILEPEEYTLIENFKKQPSGLIFRGYRNKNGFKNGVRPEAIHLSRNHKQPNRIYSTEGYHPTIPSQETSGRFFIYDEENKYVRKLTLNECYRIMGFPENFKKHKIKGSAYKQIGNSIPVPVVEALVKEIKRQGLI